VPAAQVQADKHGLTRIVPFPFLSVFIRVHP
jgi:hypothetical protein